jgi:hypothetical protein
MVAWKLLAPASLLCLAAVARADVNPVADWRIMVHQGQADAKAVNFAAAEYSRDSGERVKFVFSCEAASTGGPGASARNLRLTIIAPKASFHLHRETGDKPWSYFITKFGDNPSVPHSQIVTRYPNVDFLEFAPDPAPWDNNPSYAGEAGKQAAAKYAATMTVEGAIVGSSGDLLRNRTLFVELEFETGDDTFEVDLKNPVLNKYVKDCTAAAPAG